MMYSYTSPLGNLSYEWDGVVCSHLWLKDGCKPTHVDPVSAWLDGYFSRRILPLPPLATAKSAFQSKLRNQLIRLPFAQRQTYGELAKLLDTAPRALGQALGANPLPILIPCHRVVSAQGIGGFAYGFAWKSQLLDFEQPNA